MSDYLVDVHGLRTFRVSDDGQLLPVFVTDDSWRGGQCIARCRGRVDHQAPADGCRCGIYTFRNLQVLRDQYDLAEHLVAVVALEGQTLAGSRGWRSQAARVLDIWVAPEGLPEQLADRLRANLPGVRFHTDAFEMISGYPDLVASRGADPGREQFTAFGPVRRPAGRPALRLHRVPGYLLVAAICAALFVTAAHRMAAGDLRWAAWWDRVSGVGEYLGTHVQDLFLPVLMLGVWISVRRIRGLPAVVLVWILRVIIPVGVGAAAAQWVLYGTLGVSPLFTGYFLVICWLWLAQFAMAVGRTDGLTGTAARGLLQLGQRAARAVRPARRGTGVAYTARMRHPIAGYPLVSPVRFMPPTPGT